MSLRPVRHFKVLNAINVFLVAVATSIVGVYFIFDFYLTSVSHELMSSWVQSEAVAIQEGNLLSSISKNQRVLLSSQFVKGVTLFDTTSSPATRLIEVGSRFEPMDVTLKGNANLQVFNSGFLNKQSVYKIPNSPDLVLVFGIESRFLQKLFFATIAVLLLFIISLFGAIKTVQRQEFLKRERFLKDALSDFVDHGHPSNVVAEKLPFLVKWWNDKKLESERARRLAIENESKILLGELATRVAHDIRSPLNTINSVTTACENIPDQNKKLLKSAIQRIRDIADGIVDRKEQSLLYDNRHITTHHIVETKTQILLLSPILESIVTEKRAEHRDKNIDIDIENSVDAIEIKGIIRVGLSHTNDEVTITVKDSGIGIQPELISRIGEKGFSLGKKNGSGLGVYYAMEVVRSWGGDFSVTSRVGDGTCVGITLKKESPPDWCATNLELEKNSTVIILDDDPTIHAIWQDRMKGTAEDLKIEHFFDPESVMEWFARNRGNLGEYYILSDYELRSAKANGLDVIENLGVRPENVLLVTSAFEDLNLRAKCDALDIKILPKPAIAQIPIGLV